MIQSLCRKRLKLWQKCRDYSQQNTVLPQKTDPIWGQYNFKRFLNVHNTCIFFKLIPVRLLLGLTLRVNLHISPHTNCLAHNSANVIWLKMSIKSICFPLGTGKSPAQQSANALMGQEGDLGYKRQTTLPSQIQ